MAGRKEIRTRIASVKTTRQVTSAMKLVAAAKLKKAQDAVINFRPYVKNYHTILDSVISGLDNVSDTEFTAPREPAKILVILVTSGHGLCGGFNANVTHSGVDMVNAKYNKQLKNNQLHFIAVGKQGERLLRNLKMPLQGNKNDLMEKLTFEQASKVAEEIMDGYKKRNYDRVELVYNDFVNATQHIPVQELFLPLQLPQQENQEMPENIIFEPSRQEILAEMIPMWLKIQFYKALLVSLAAEHGARMTAMHQATDNATELLGALILQYNKARQAAITNEILEITGGAEAMAK